MQWTPWTFVRVTLNATPFLERGANETSEGESLPSKGFLMLGMIVTMMVMVVGSIGNLLTLCTLAHQFCMPRRARYIKDLTPDTVLIINLALADLFYSAISLPFMFTTYYRLDQGKEDPWKENPAGCQVSAFLRYTNAIAEWTTLGLMALERCVTIYNFRTCRGPSRLFTTFKTISFCCTIWILATLCQLPTLTGKFGSFGYNERFVKCDFVVFDESSATISPRVVFFALESAVPCVLILIGYLVILSQVYSSSSRLSFLGSHSCQRMVAVRRSRTTRVIVKLLFVYLVCVLPVCVFNLCEAPNPGKHKDGGIAVYCLYWLQYCVNNFIYVVSNGRYRCAYYQFLCWITCHGVPYPATPSPHATPHRCQIYNISSSNTLQQSLNSRCRTPSECEEARRRVHDYAPRSSFFVNFLSSETRNNRRNEAVHPSLSVSLSPDSCLSLRCHSASFSSTTSSTQTLVNTQHRARHLSHSVRRDLKEAGHKLRRTFSC